jgi:HD-like signal output (HDOD) protein
VQLIRAAAGACSLPSAPDTYLELVELLGRGGATTAEVAEVVKRDIAISAKVLQLANSGYFGSDQAVSSVSDAVALLGHETIQAITLSSGAFQKLAPAGPIPGFSLEHVQHRALHVARVARVLSDDAPATEDAFAAGLLLDIGLLVLASQEPEYLGDVLLAAEREGRPLHEVELDRKGITHAEIGAHLFALWGLPHTIVEAVAHHHRPLRSPIPAFDTVAVAHIADALVPDAQGGRADAASTLGRIDADYVDRIGVTGRIAEWQRLAASELATTPA